jgi:outer membrane protein TolC
MSKRTAQTWVLPAGCLLATLFAGCLATHPPPRTGAPGTASSPTDTPPATAVVTVERRIPEPLSLLAAIQRADSLNPEIVAARYAVEAAAAEHQSAGDLRNPEVRLGYGTRNGDHTQTRSVDPALNPTWQPDPTDVYTNTVRHTDSDRLGYSVAMRLFPPNPWEMAARRAGANARLLAAQLRLAATQWSVAGQVTALGTEIDSLEQEAAQLDSLVAISATNVQRTAQLAQSNQATLQDQVSVTRDHMKWLSERTRLRQRLGELHATLAGLLGASAREVRVRMAPGDLPAPTLSASHRVVLCEKAQAHRADYAARALESAAAWHAYRESRASEIPWFSHIQVSVDRFTTEGTENPSDTVPQIASVPEVVLDEEQEVEWRVETGIVLPVFEWAGRNQAPRVRYSQYRAARAAEEAEADRIRREVAVALESLLNTRESLQEYLANTSNGVAQVRAVLNTGLPNLPPAEADRIRIQHVETERMRIQLQGLERLATLRLQQAVGMPLDGVAPRLPGP